MSLADALGRLPLFPLPDVTLFPGELVPLHVFEPRYRQMTRDALETHRALALARVLAGAPIDEHGHPPIPSIVGAGTIVDHEALPGGRYDLLVRGEARVELAELPFVAPYRVARATVLADPAPPPDEGDVDALIVVALALIRRLRARDAGPTRWLRDARPAGRAADLLAARFVLDPDARQRLIEEPSAAARTAAVTRSLAEVLRRLGGDAN